MDALGDEPRGQVAVGVPGEDQDPGRGQLCADLAHDLQAVHAGKVEVHDQEARGILQAVIDRRLSVLEAAGNHEPAHPAQRRGEHLPEYNLVVYDNGSYGHVGITLKGDRPGCKSVEEG
jgi:hypothetical protein